MRLDAERVAILRGAASGSPVKRTILWGDRNKGEYAQLLRIPAGFVAPIHAHSGDYHGVAHLTPFGQGYGFTEELPMRGFLHGRVVDMFYFPMTTIQLPEWLGGGSFLFFSPIFNVADAAITTGVLSILLFQRRFFKDGFVEEQKTPPAIFGEENPQPEDIFEKPELEAETSFEITEPSTDGQSRENGTTAEQPAESRPEENREA